jgi:hypothetical protein
MMDVFCDESHDAHVYALAGWMAAPTGWKYFVPAWNRMLGELRMPDGSPVRAFHAAEIVNRDEYNNRFKGWTFEDEKRAFGSAVDVIVDRQAAANLWPIGCAIVIPRDADWVETRDTLWHLLFTRLFLALLNTYPAQNGFAFTFDEKKEIKRHANEFYALAKQLVDGAAPGKLASAEVKFASDEDFPQLQGADLFVYEWRRRITERLTKPDKRVRTSYARIKEARFEDAALLCYDPTVVSAIKAQLEVGGSFVEAMVKHPATQD